ncbi:aspartoacylase [Salinivibrio kushneri]|uniref:aspartoacylase n=1 Tax=Salinivibrio kushneri TaxID=1908198 RepID=UPI0009844680|nr:aspartoacylase [Salinivibrio kushneri]OOE48994.1 aspartoacylase [Salinivibrio kushneri]OOE49456.1 aspartoacylase [Salinivibrio kushneri]OOE62802.1 aspartoacylase [Salinivibrio kushneri]
MSRFSNVAIVGGTHGNEFSGIYALKQWQSNPTITARDSFSTEHVFANPSAYSANKRYLDCDLNRQFDPKLLADYSLANYEQSRAKALNQQLGPKGDPRVDFIIDLHNTTSNMGPTLILLTLDMFNKQLAAYISERMPDAIILVEDHIEPIQHAFLCSIGKQGVIVEVGPQPQSVLRHDVMESMQEMTTHILDFVHLFNIDKVPALPKSITAYRYKETLHLPQNAHGERIGMVHQHVQDKDFQPIQPGEPLFMCFDGTELTWQGDYTAYPHFINEAAYYDNNIAMSMANVFTLTV